MSALTVGSPRRVSIFRSPGRAEDAGGCRGPRLSRPLPGCLGLLMGSRAKGVLFLPRHLADAARAAAPSHPAFRNCGWFLRWGEECRVQRDLQAPSKPPALVAFGKQTGVQKPRGTARGGRGPVIPPA